MSQNVADSLNNSTAADKTDELHYSRTPTPPPPPKLSKSHSIISYQFLDCDAINNYNKALMPSLENHYNCCPSLYAASNNSHTLDKRHKHKCRHHHHHYQHNQHQHQYHHHHHHHHNHQNQILQTDSTNQAQLCHHQSSPSIQLNTIKKSSQKTLKSSSSSLSFLFGAYNNSSNNSNTNDIATYQTSTPKSSKTKSTPFAFTTITPRIRAHSKWRNSSYHSCDDLDAATATATAANKYHSKSSAERKVVKSLKYLCACTGATLRNLSKRTKDLHAKNYHGYAEPTWRVWGEEREKNAIFTVYLKKVRYHRPTPTASVDTDGEISHLAWETVRVRFVKAATLARLVEALATDDGELESTFINVFLSTYRTFSTPKEVLNLLIRRYNTLHEKFLQELEEHGRTAPNTYDGNLIESGRYNSGSDYDNAVTTRNVTEGDGTDYDPSTSIHEQHKRTLVSALHVWLDGFPEDWNEENLRLILAFAAKRLPHTELHSKVHHRLERLLRQQYERQQYSSLGCAADGNIPPWLSSSASGNGVFTNGLNSVNSGGILSQQYGNDLADQFNSIYIAPVFRPPAHFLQAFRFPHIPVRHFAEQLTRMDSELFKRLIPHQCLGATWARRDKSGSETVVATINQFNAVLFRVISSILIEPRLKPQERALNIATWIDIAQELRLLKNFSSLKAIISGLQSFAIYRLSKTWAALPKEKMEIFNELARIFSEDNNAWAQREVLMREGTAKFADTVGENDSHLQKIIQKQSTQTSHGTIPYLGIFLTDLTMIHAAIPDTIAEEGFINFDKKRKEFEVLAQIKLLQGAANTYNLREDQNFDRWFVSMPVLDEREAHTLSYQLEAAQQPAPRKSLTTLTTNSSGNASLISGGNTTTHVNGHRKTDSIASNSSSGAGSQFYCEVNTSLESRYSSRHSSLDRDAQLQQHTLMMSASSSVSNLSLDSSNSGGGQTRSNSNNSRLTHSQSANGMQTPNAKNGSPMINGQCKQTPDGKTPDFYIIRVTYETDNIELDGIVLYKSIMLGNNERTPQVIRNAMMKLGLDADPENYTLAQVLPDKELVMPKDANVYYAVNTNYNLNFILRPKKDAGKNGSSNNTTS